MKSKIAKYVRNTIFFIVKVAALFFAITLAYGIYLHYQEKQTKERIRSAHKKIQIGDTAENFFQAIQSFGCNLIGINKEGMDQEIKTSLDLSNFLASGTSEPLIRVETYGPRYFLSGKYSFTAKFNFEQRIALIEDIFVGPGDWVLGGMLRYEILVPED